LSKSSKFVHFYNFYLISKYNRTPESPHQRINIHFSMYDITYRILLIKSQHKKIEVCLRRMSQRALTPTRSNL